MATGAVADAPQRGFFGHPRGLSTLFFTEMWERFSYYGMRAILLLYLYYAVTEGGLGVDESSAASLVGAYGASVYLTSVAGGWLADRILGARKSVFYGGLLIMFGHICMALPGGVPTTILGIALIVVGSGFLKPNISKMVGDLYTEQDDRRDAGFTIFYMGINIGALIGQIITGYLQVEMGFHWGFGAAAVGMALGLTQYVLGGRNLGQAGLRPQNPLPANAKGSVIARVVGITAAILVVLAGSFVLGLIGIDGLVNMITAIAIIMPIAYFTVMLRSTQITNIERDRLIAYIPLFLATALFFLLFEQQATSLVLVADQQTDTTVLGYEFPVAWFQSLNPLAIIIMAPIFATLWVKLGARQPSTPMKFVGGLVLIAASFLWIVLSGFLMNSNGQHFALMLAMVFVIMTAGELMLSPVGLSATTKLAPKAFASQTLGLYFLAPALGQALGAQIVKLYSAEQEGLYFGLIGLVTLAFAGLLAVGVKKIKPYMHGVT